MRRALRCACRSGARGERPGHVPATPVGAGASSQTIVFQNEPFALPVTLGQPAVSGDDAAAFPVLADSCAGRTLYGSEACNVTVIFRPGRIGAHTATLQVPVEGEPDAPFSSGLSGEGIPWLRLTPPVLDFGTLLGFTGATQDVLVENVSGREISLLTRIEPVAGDFRRSPGPAPDRCARRLAAGATCHVGIRFSPRPGFASEGRLVFGSQMEMGSVILRGTGAPRPPATPIKFPTPDATAVLRKRLRAALARLRGRSREVLLKRGLIVRGIVPPAQGVLGLVVRGRRASPLRQDASPAATLMAARRRLPVQADRKATIRAHLTRAGRRLLRSGRPLLLDVKLTLVARSDDRLSEATGGLRLGRVPKRR